ncbi:MAG: putative metallopeptidase [Candidatus Micrarchaeota archaeon]
MAYTIYEPGQAEDVKEIARRLLQEYSDDFKDIDLNEIYFQRSKSTGFRRWGARVFKVMGIWRHLTKVPLIIEVNEEYFDKEIDDKTRKMVVYHELCHIAVGFDEGNQKNYGIRGHDIQDFKQVVATFGESIHFKPHELMQARTKMQENKNRDASVKGVKE